LDRASPYKVKVGITKRGPSINKIVGGGKDGSKHGKWWSRGR